MKKIYKVNGKTFWTMDDVNKYCIENNFRITNTETIKYKGIPITYLISVVSN